MGRNSGKRVHRRSKAQKPTVQSLEEYISRNRIKAVDQANYGIITRYNGGGGMCAVKILLSTGFQEFPKIRLKGTYADKKVGRKLNQKLASGSLVIVDDGTIVLVYQPNEHSVIDRKTLAKLSGTQYDDGIIVDEDDYLPPEEEEEEEESEEEEEDDITFYGEPEEEEEEDIDSI